MPYDTRILVTLICDKCKKEEDFHDGETELNPSDAAEVVKETITPELRDDSEWAWLEDGKILCPDCYTPPCEHDPAWNSLTIIDIGTGGATVELLCKNCEITGQANVSPFDWDTAPPGPRRGSCGCMISAVPTTDVEKFYCPTHEREVDILEDFDLDAHEHYEPLHKCILCGEPICEVCAKEHRRQKHAVEV